MKDLILIFFTISVVISLIYFIYKLILDSDETGSKEELQITHDDILEQIEILRRQKKYSIVENLGKKYLEKKPQDDELRIILMKCLHENGRGGEALEQAKIIIKHQPHNHQIKIFMANCYLEMMQPMKAISYFQEVLEDDPNNVIAIRDLAKVFFDTNQRRSALKMYERLDEFIYSNHEKVENKNLMAQINIEFKDYEDAIGHYQEILDIYPDDIEVEKKIIDLYKKLNDYDYAIERTLDLLELHAIDEYGLWALNTLSDAYTKTKDFEKALEYANLIKDHPLSNKLTASNNIADILMETGRIDESINILTALEFENPEDIGIKKSLAKAYESKKDYESAIQTYKKILDKVGTEEVKQIHNDMSDIYSSWATHLFEQKDNVNCFKKFTLAVQYNNSNPNVYFKLGQVNQSIKNFNEAISQYKKAIELNNKNGLYYYAIAECYSEIDNSFEEKKALNECIKYEPMHTKAYFKLALLYETQNDKQNAMKMIKKVLELDDNFVEAKYKLAIMYEHQGDKENAMELYEQILNVNPEHKESLNNLKMLKG